MFKKESFFERLCEAYYEKVLRYLYGALGQEQAARDCAQEVFLVACQKEAQLQGHPNPGGFLFQTAKNLGCKYRREGFRRMMEDLPLDESGVTYADERADVFCQLDREIDEYAYVNEVLDGLSADKRRLYDLYYLGHWSMADIAAELGMQEPALRMRYVRLRREIQERVCQVAKTFEV